jgi:DNA polymerase-1
MRHHIFTQAPSDSYPVAILIKSVAFTKHELQKAYVQPLVDSGVALEDIIAFTLQYDDHKKVANATIKDYLSQLLPELDALGSKYLFTMDGNYFKVLSGQKQADPHIGYVLPCKIKGYEHLQVVYGLNWQTFIYNPEAQKKLALSINALASQMAGEYAAIGVDIIHEEYYPESIEAIQEALNSLHDYPAISADIEAFSLRFNEAGIGTIAFAVDQHNGFAFRCDYQPYAEKSPSGLYGEYVKNHAVRQLIKDFLTSYKGRIRWHRSQYDLKVIVYTLWMDNLLDQKGCLDGLDVVFERADDTKHIAYLATNSTAGNELGLKVLAHPFAGNYAQDEISDIRKIPLSQLLRYNLIDCLATNYVYDTYYPRMVQDQQLALYETMFMPSQKMQTQAELVGMPMGRAELKEVKDKLMSISVGHMYTLTHQPLIKEMDAWLRNKKWVKDYEDRKKKAKNPDKIKWKELEAFDDHHFNPNSPLQMQELLYEKMGLPVIDYTDTKQPAVGGDTLEKLIHHCTSNDHVLIIEALMGWSEANKILTTFIPAFEQGIIKADDGIIWLHGNFNLGGTVSGRLSSSEPNMQNIPANSTFGKLIKTIFKAPSGWLFGGADFNSLEDYISALTSRDPMKLKVYTDGFDGHCLRARFYYPEELGHIDMNDPKAVNAIAEDFPKLRQESKTPTFALTYQGTYYTLMQNLGWPEEKAKRVEKAYHELYKVSDQYIQDRIRDEACAKGYVTVAFGLRIRTPLLGQCIYGANLPYEAKAEGRTVGNAMGQSYGLLNNRAAVEFWKKVWASPYRYDILPCGLIHDAIYLLMREDPAVVEFANRELIKSMAWQDLPELAHDTVKIGAALDIFWPDWSNGITLPINASQEQIIETCNKGVQKYEDALMKKLKEAA